MNVPKPLAIVILILVVGLGILLTIIVDRGQKNHEQIEKQTIEQEWQKKFSAIKIVNIVDTIRAVDAFGNKLKAGEWYVQSNVTHSVFPINTKSTNYTNLDWLMNNGNKELARVKITNGEPLGAYVDAEILLLGDKRLVLNDLEQYQVVSVK